jgi:3-hydroxyisobutyrate dehydrogenase
MGPLGSGNVMKLISNLSMASYIHSLAEGIALAQSYKLDLNQVIEVMHLSPSANPWLKFRGPALFTESEEVTLDISSLRKDINNTLICGATNGLSLGLTATTLNFLSSAVAFGLAKDDIVKLPKFLLENFKQNPA